MNIKKPLITRIVGNGFKPFPTLIIIVFLFVETGYSASGTLKLRPALQFSDMGREVIKNAGDTIKVQSEQGNGTENTGEGTGTKQEHALPTGFELDSIPDTETIAKNEEYLKSKGWLVPELERVRRRYKRPFIFEDKLLPRFLEAMRDQIISAKIYGPMMQKTLQDALDKLEGQLRSGGISEVEIEQIKARDKTKREVTIPTVEECIPEAEEIIKHNIVAIAHFLQALHYSSQHRTEDTKMALAGMLVTASDTPEEQKFNILLYFNRSPSDTLFSLAQNIFMRVDFSRARYVFNLALSEFNADKYHVFEPEEFASRIALANGCVNFTGALDMLDIMLTIRNSSFAQKGQRWASANDERGRGLTAHFRQTKVETMKASAKVDKLGTALVLGSGCFVVLPIVEMLRERLPNGELKYKKIILVDVAPDLSKKTIADMLNTGIIHPEEAARMEVIKSDATLVLKGLTAKFDEVLMEALKSNTPVQFPVERIIQLCEEIFVRGGLANYVEPVNERLIKDESINFAVFAMSLQDFASSFKDYFQEIWLPVFTNQKEVRAALKQWDNEKFMKLIAPIILEDLSRVLVPDGVVFFGDVIGFERSVGIASKNQQGERSYLYSKGCLKTLLPKYLPLRIIDRTEWRRPTNSKDSASKFIVESLCLKKAKSISGSGTKAPRNCL